jgi:hypothetical protein
MATSDAGLSSLTLATYSTNNYYSTYLSGASASGFQTPASSLTNIIGTASVTTTSTFTIEAWIYQLARHSLAAGPVMCGDMTITAGTNTFSFGPSSTGLLQFYWWDGAVKACAGNTTIPLSTWTHIAVSISSGSIKLFVNGNLETLSGNTTTTNSTGTTGYFAVGGYTSAGTTWYGYSGYISNLRVLKNTAAYSTSFTPPTKQLTAIANTNLLICNTNSFTDSSVNNYTLTLTGATNLSFRQFTPILQANANVTLSPTFSTGTTSYTFSAPSNIVAISLTPTANDATYSSIKFNSNVSLTSGQANIASSTPSFTSGYSGNFVSGSLQYANIAPVNTTGYSFTIEFWLYPTSYTAQQTLFAKRVASTTTTSYQGYLTVTSGYIGFYNGTAYASTYAPILNQWSHIAYTYDGSYITIYVRGSRVYSVQVALGADNAGPLQIGGPIGYTEWVVGNISNFRMIKGYQIYTGDFAVPTSPLGLTQNASTNIRAITGGPTTQGSLYLKGASSQWVSFPAGSGTSGDLGAGDFTLECWTYLYSRVNLYPIIFDNAGALGQPNRVLFTAGHNSVDTTKYNLFVGGGSQTNFSTSVIYNSWVHIALVRVGTIITLYVNGKADATTITSSTNLFGITTAYVGGSQGDAANCSLNGLISNFRIVKGTAQYTQNFIPSGVPFTVAGNTTLLALQTNITSDASSLNSTITASGSPSFVLYNPYTGVASTVQPNSSSISLPGSTEINFGSNAGFSFGTGAYTVEFWVYPNIATSTYGSTNGPILVFNDTTGGWGIWDQNANGVGNGIVISARAGLNILGSATSLTVGAWNHVVAVRNTITTNQTSIFLNGTRIANGTDATNWTVTGPLKIGGISTAGYYLNGYMSNVRVVKGYAVYDPNLITLNVPKSPLVAITNTQLLALQTSITSDISTNNITATTSGTPTLSTTISPFIIYGSGSNQYLSTALAYQTVSSAYSPALSLGQGHNNFTAEAWVYLNTQAPSAGQGWFIIQKGDGSTPGREWTLNIALNNIIFSAYQGIPTIGSGVFGSFSIGTSPVGQWLHIALTKVGTSVNIWYNGNYLGTVNGVNNLLYTAHVASYITIANSQTGVTGAFNGYISNARVVYGKALYTVNYDVGFTPSTTPLNPTQSATSSVASIDNASSYVVNNGSSVYFNNSNDFLTFPEPASNFYSALFNGSSYFDVIGTPVPLTGQFTIEAWVYTTVSATQIIYSQYTSADANRWTFNIDNNTGYKLSFAHGTAATVSAATVVPLNQWNHVAVSRDSNNTLRLFLNGVVDGSQTSYTASLQQTGARIGFFNNSPSVYFNGYISNMRVVNGSAIYTGTFTPSTIPLTRTSQGATASQVSFLALQNNTLKDNSTNAFAITNTGVTIAQKHPFTAYGDGSDVTVEAWVLLGVAPTTRGWIINNSATSTGYFGVAIEAARTVTVWSDSNVTAVLTSSTVIPLYTWTHIAVTLVNNLLVIYINGVRDINTVAKTTVWQAATLGTVYIGRQASAAAQYFPGYLTNVRMVYGTAIYTARFTVPSDPLTATLNTVFLGLQSSVTFDNSVNNATITKGSGATGLILAPLTSPFSTYIPTVTNGYSLAFNWLTAAGNDDYLTVATGYLTSTQLPGDFTIESWIFMTVLPSQYATIIDTRSVTSDAGYVWHVTSTGTLRFFTSNSASLTSTATLTINTWYHISVTRQNTTFKFWINGIQDITTSTTNGSTDLGVRSVSNIRIGASIDPYYFPGYLSNIRFIIGTAIYTGTFTPSITPYSLTSVTSTNTLPVTGITTYPAVGNPNGTNYSGSYYFGGGSASGSIISMPNANNVGRLELATYDFTIEAWFYSTAAGGTQVILSAATVSSSDFAWRLYLGKAAIGSQGTLNFETYAGFSTTQFTNLSPTLTINSFQWYHVAVVRTVNIITIYLNGIAASTQIIPVSQQYFGQSTATTPSIGGQYSSAGNYVNFFYGYISNARVIKGYAVYTGNFTPSTSPLTNTQNIINNSNTITGTVTSLLALQNSTTTDASSNNLTLTATGSPTVSSTIIPYLPTTNGYSTYFDGNVYMTIPFNINLTPVSSDFTVETWIYLPSVTSLATSSMIIISQSFGTGDTGNWVLFYRYDLSRWEFAANATDGTAAGLQRSYNTTVPVANQWFHIAGVKRGSTISCYVNGVKGTDGTITTVYNASNSIWIGAFTNGSGKITGYLSNLRIVKGIAVYTGNFTVPTNALGSIQSSSTNIAALASNSTFYNSFNGSSQYLSIPNSVALQLGTTYTAEAWGYLTSYGTNLRLFSDGSSNNNNLDFYVTNGGNFGVAGGTATSSQTFPLNSWVHVALVVNSGALVVYINGVSATMTGTTTGYNNNVTSTRYIGSTAGSFLWTGFISNVRFVKGVAVYTGNFAIPTGPLTATQSSGTNISAITSETVLLTCQSSTIVDNSSSASTITNVAGVVPVSTLAVFTYTQLLMFQTTASNFDASVAGNGFGSTITGTLTVSPANMAYSPFVSSNGRSVFFTGSSQYIQAPSNSVFTFGSSNDFTIEGWIYLASNTTSGTLYDSRTGASTVSAQIYIQSNIVNYAVAGVSVINSSTTTSLLSAATWYHIAVVRISNVTKLYINGIQAGNSYTDTNNYVIGAPYIGTGYNSSNPLNGYISNLRVVNGTGVYSNNFFVPITALTSTQSSSSTIIALNNSIPSLGNSVYFNGANDYMKIPGMVCDMGTGDFTIETYYYPTSFAAITTLFGQYTAATTALGYWNMQVTTAGIITVYYNGSTNFTASTAILINEWAHIVLVRVSSTITLYVNGVSYGTASYSGIFGLTNTASPLHIGATQLSGPTQYALGYMSNLRIVKGVGVYTGAFTVPTSPLGVTQSSGTNISAITGVSTSLLLYQNSPFTDNSTYADTVTPFGSPQYSPVFSPSFFSYPTPANANSGYFNGTSSYLSLTQPSNGGTGDLTIEMWVYPTSITTASCILSNSIANNTGTFAIIIDNNTGLISVSIDQSSPNLVSTGPSRTKPYTWTHIAVVRFSGIMYLYVNGYRQTSTLTKATTFADTGVLNIGRYLPSVNQYFSGYITNVRFVYGTALYTGTYSTPPYTTPLTAITNTTLLLLQTTLVKDNSTNNVTVTNNNVILSTYTNPYTMMKLPVLLTGQNSRDVTSTTGFRDNSMYNATLTSGALAYASHQPAVSPFGIAPTLLLAQSSRGRDSSINNYTISAAQNTAIMPYVTPFSSTTNAIAFNGSTQYITNSSTSANLYGGMGGDFTIEFFMMAGPQTASTGALILGRNIAYPSLTNNNYYIMCSHPGVGHAGATSLQTIQIYSYSYSTTTPVFVGATPVCDSKWHHIAIVRISNIVKVYIDGVLDTSPTNSFTNTGIWDYSNYTIGSSSTDGTYTVANLAYNGMLSNLRIINRVGIYTGTFTPPTTNLTLSQTSRTNVVAYTATTLPSTTSNSISIIGPNQQLSIQYITTLNLGLNDYTIEFWHYLAGKVTTNPALFVNGNLNTAGAIAMYAGHSAGNPLKYQLNFNAQTVITTNVTMQSVSNVIYGQWTHIALVRRSGIVYLYINGVLDSSSTLGNYSIYSYQRGYWILGSEFGASNSIYGMISNFRVVSGLGVYTGNFTVPTSALTTTQSSSTNITAISNSLITNGGAVAYPYGTAGQFIYGNLTLNATSTNITVECWVYLYALPTTDTWSSNNVATFYSTSQNTTATGIHFSIGASTIFIVVTNTVYGGFSHNMAASTWYHLAYVINNGAVTFYVNGISVGSMLNIPTTFVTNTPAGIATSIGASNQAGNNSIDVLIGGYISNLRVLKSIALYTGNFTPSTVPLTNTQSAVTNVNAITGTSTALLALQNSISTDASTNNLTLTATGNPTLNTKVYPNFATTNARSAYFQSVSAVSGTSSITVPSSISIYNYNIGTFTLECWVYPINFGGTYQIIISNDAATGLTPFGINASGTIFYGYSPTSSYGQTGVTSTVVTFNAWNHLAFVRSYAASGGTVTIYINGQSGYTGSNTIAYTQGVMRIGAEQNGTTFPFNGYISNVRLVNGIALYTSNFTVPTSPLSITQSANVNGNPSSAIAVNTYAGYFNGSQSVSTVGTVGQFVLGNNNFTIECYFNTSASGNPVYLFDFRGSDSVPYPSIYVSSNVLYYFTLGATRIASSTLLSFTWYHCAVTRNNNVTTLYLNGVAQGTYTDTNTYQVAASKPIIGSIYTGGGSNYFYGYISNVRIVNGSIVYTGTFTPPTINLTSTQSLGTNINAISAPTTSNGYYNNYFTNSTSQYLSVPGSQFVFGTNPFTIECYVYTLSLANNQVLIDNWVNNTFVIGQWQLFINSTTGYITFSYATSTVAQTNIITTIAVPLGRWTHVAVVRTSTSTNGFAIYVHGLLAQTVTLSASIGVNITSSIGIQTSTKTTPFNGFISNVRLTNGVAVYTGIYSPQSSPLTATQSSVSTTQSSLLVAQNATTTDASTNAFTLTAVGSPTLNIASPFAVTNGASVFFNGGNYLSANNIQGVVFNTADFTVEVYAYCTNSTAMNLIFSTLNGGNDTGFFIGFFTAGIFSYGGYVTKTSLDSATTSALFNVWTHIAYVRINGVENLYFNGVLVSTTTRSLSFTINTNNYIGYAAIGGYFSGYLTNLRIVKGLGVYTGNFTPPTQPLSITQSSGTNIQAITGTVPTNGSSVNFNGSSYLSTTGSSQLEFANSQYTVEFWFYVTSLGVQQCFYDLRSSTTSNIASNFSIVSSGTINFGVGNATLISQLPSPAPVINTWYHIAVVRTNQNTNGVTVYLNGISIATGTDPYTHLQYGLRIGQFGNGSQPLTGYISNFRILVGTALYTSNFVPSSVPLTAITNTKILVLQNSTTTDASPVNYTLTATGTVTLSTTISPFIYITQLLALQNSATTDASINAITLGNSGVTLTPLITPFAVVNGNSVYFTGSSQYLTIPSNSSLQFGTQDFTIECWVYILNGNTGTLYDGRTTLTSTSPVIYINASTVYYAVGNTIAITGLPLSNTTWYHIAVTRVSNNTSLYINGVQTGVIYADNNVFNTVNTPAIGTGLSGTNPLNGYITNLRIVKNLAVYTNNFVVPILPLTATVGGNIAAIPSLTTTNGYYTNSFNGTNQYLTIPANAVFAFGTGDFTVEAWVFSITRIGSGNYGSQIAGCQVFGSTADWLFNISLTGNLYFQISSSATGAILSTSTVPLSTWTHVAAVRASGTMTLYINGTNAGGSGSYATSITNASTPFSIGGASNGSANSLMQGFISNVRVTKGVAVYTGAFTPQTTPLAATQSSGTNIAAITGTSVSLLTCQSSTIIDNSTFSATNIITNSNSVNTTIAIGLFGNNSGVSLLTSQSSTIVDNSASTVSITNTGAVTTVPVINLFKVNNGVTQLLTLQNNTTLVDNSYNAFILGNGTTIVPANGLFNTGTTQLLALQTSLTNDVGYYGVTLTPAGYTQLSTASPFVAPNGSSVSFTGSGNYLSIASNNVFTIGTNDFTIEGWIYLTGVTTTGTLYDVRTGLTTVSSQIYINSNVVYYAVAGNNVITGSAITAGLWYHIAVVRISNVTKLYINGVISGNTYADTNNYVIGAPFIGQGFNNTYPLNGYISNLRVVNGTGVYVYNFTPQTTPLTATQSSSASTKALTALPTTGYYSGFFDGSTAYLSVPNTNIGALSGNAWTIEAWVYFTKYPAGTGAYNVALLSTINASNNAGFLVNFTGSATAISGFGVYAWATPSTISNTFGYNFSLATWYHVAVTRNSVGLFTAYVNGTSIGSITNTGTWVDNATYYIGYNGQGSYPYYMPGFISNLRITYGLDIYTTNFTPSTTTLTATQSANTNGSPSSAIALSTNTGYYNLLYTGVTTQYLTVPGAGFVFGTNPFTIECWVYLTSLPATVQVLIDNLGTSGSYVIGQWQLSLTASTGNINFFYATSVSGLTTITTSFSPLKVATWTHIAVTRSNDKASILIYINGSSNNGNNVFGGISTTQPFGAPTTSTIGIQNSTKTLPLYGYITNIRFTYGIPVYYTQATLTPPTSPLTNTQSGGGFVSASLLALQNSTTTDASSNGLTLTATGSPTLTAYPSPFTGTGVQQYGMILSTSLYAYPTNSIVFGTSDFTIEFWYAPYYTNNSYLMDFRGPSDSGVGYIVITTNVVSPPYTVTFNNTVIGLTSGSAITTVGTFYHIAISRSGGTTRMFVNGTQTASGADTTSYGAGANRPVIGTNNNLNFGPNLSNYISTVRIVKDTGIYTGNFTAPTTPLQATQYASSNIGAIISGQTELLALNSATITADGSGKNNTLTSNYSTQINGPTLNPTPTNGSSVYFSTSSQQYIVAPSNAAFNFNIFSFTIEGWIYLYAGTSGTLYDGRTGLTTVSPQIYISSSTIYYAVGGTVAITGSSVNTFTWYHIALVKSSTSTKLYVNGTQSGSTYTDNNTYVVGAPYIGAGFNYSNPLNGFITNLRVVNGTAAYTTTFTPSTTPLTNSVSTGGAITAISAPTTSNGYYATAHAGLTTQYLSLPGTPFVLGTNPFTVECWVYSSSLASNQVFVDNWVNTTFVVGQWTLYSLATTGYVVFAYATSTVAQTIITTTIGVPIGQWTHVAAVRTSTSTNGFVIYINGVVGITTTISVSIGTNATSSIGILTSNKTAPMTGFISNVRITNLAVYTGAFTPQTTPLSATQSSGTNIAAITGTSVALLTSQSSTIVDNSTFAVTITNTGVVEKVIAFGLFNNNTGVSLLTAQNATFIDNSVNAVTISNPGATPVTSPQLIGLFGTSITKLLALQTTLTGDASIYNNTITNVSTNVLLEKTFSPMGGYVQPSLLAQQSGQFIDNSVNQINTAAPYYWAGARTAYQTTMTPYGVQTPTVLLTAQNATLLSDSTGYHGGVNTGVISATGTTVTNTFSGPFNNDTLLLTFQGSLITENSNLRPQLNIIGGGVAPTDSNPFTTSKSLTGLLIPYGYNDISIANSPIANNAAIAQSVTVYNPFTIPSSLVSVLALQTSNTVLESSINLNTFTTSGTAPTSSTNSPFGTYNGNGILILNTASTLGITANIVNYANLLVTANDGVTTNSYSIAVTALNTNNIGNRATVDAGYNPPAPNVALYIDTTTSNITLLEPLYNTPITPNIGNIIITQWMTQDYRNSTLVANTQTGAANILVSEAFNSNITEPVINTPIPLSGNIILTQWMTQDYRNSTLIANASTGGANLFVTSVGNIANISLVEPTSNVFLANTFSTPRVIVDVGTNPPSSSVVPTLYPTYAYTDGVFITAANVQGGTGGSSFASNQQIWY